MATALDEQLGSGYPHVHQLKAFVTTECAARLAAYSAQPRDRNEHYETEIEVLSGGYAYRQLFELVQNAADAIQEADENSGRIHIRLGYDRLIAANTGASLDEDGIVALLNARSSAKRAGQIGRFGIGFKSLLKLGGTVDLVSRSIGLRFDPEWCRNTILDHLELPADAKAPGMRLAQVLDPHTSGSPLKKNGEFGWATTVVTAMITDQEARDRLIKEFASFPAEFVLFLGADVELTLEVEGGLTREIEKWRDGDVYVTSDGTSENRWRLFQTNVHVTDQAARDDAQHLQTRDEVPLSWAVPLSAREIAGHFWAFFPTQTPTLAAGILNAPWKLNSDRTNLIPGSWNEYLMGRAAVLIADNLAALATPEDPGAPIAALPRKLDRQDILASALVKPLWDRLVNEEIVADATGSLRSAAELRRHPVDIQESLRHWIGFANDDARRRVVHPTCQGSKLRASRLDALAREAEERSGENAVPLAQLSFEQWLEFIASCDATRAIPVLRFIGSLLRDKIVSSRLARGAEIIPVVGEHLVSAEHAIIAPPSRTPAGHFSVLPAVAGDSDAKAVLTELLAVREMSDDLWEEVLTALYDKAADTNNVELWNAFWANFADAPEAHVAKFLESIYPECLRFFSLAGQFNTRDRMLVPGADEVTEISTAVLVDVAFHSLHWPRLPAELADRLPRSSWDDVSEWEGLGESKMKPYFDWVRDNGWAKMPSGPQRAKLDILDSRWIEMPTGWRLLPFVSSSDAASLSTKLLQCFDQRPAYSVYPTPRPFPPLRYGHTTRRDTYPKFSAPHPLLFWLNRFGRVTVGLGTYPLKCLSYQLCETLSDAGLSSFQSLQSYFAGLNQETDLKLKWESANLTSTQVKQFWDAVFSELEQRTEYFVALRPVWELAATDDQVPQTIPTALGPLPLTEIYVSHDESQRAADDDDGHIVVLSEKAALLWEKSGAKPLKSHFDVSYAKQLSEPLPLGDVFPELRPALNGRMAKTRDAAWVRELRERSGPRETCPLIARDVTGLLLLDRDRFASLSWVDRMRCLLDALHRYGLIDGNPEEVLGELTRGRVAEAREHVRAGATLADRLLRAVGDSATALLDTLPNPTKDAAGPNLAPVETAELVLAVFGPTLTKLADRLTEEGLNPPKRWGSEAATEFVLELGFPAEFASSASIRRAAELTINGPIELPPLHDYQEHILANLDEIFSSGDGRRRAAVSLPTGGGKTRVAAEAIVKLVLSGGALRTALWVAQTDELCEQAVQCFRQLWVNIGASGEDLRVVRLWGGQTNPAPPEAGEPVVVIASIQTLNARIDAEKLAWLNRPGVVVIDECHHAIAPSYTSLLRWLDVQTGTETARGSEPPVVGLSATPWRGRDDDESARLAARFDRRWLPVDQEGLYADLRSRGVLSELTYSPINYDKPIRLSESEERHFGQYGELPETLVERIGADPDRNERILECVLESPAESILLFANSVSHAQYLAARLHLAGCAAAAVSGETDRLARQHFIRRFKSGELRVICNHSVLATGFDAPKADMILISRPVFSPVRYMQMVGRGLRGPLNGGTERCGIATVEDNILNYRDRLAYHFCRRFFQTA